MKTIACTMLLAAVSLPGLAFGGPWHGEPPAWARGIGYWDGHVQHRYPPPFDFRPPVAGDFYGYGPPPYAWYGDRDWHKEERKAYKRWRKEIERQEKAYEKWRKDVRKQREKEHKKWRKELEKRHKDARKRWRKW
jgi:hypothetical protein